MEIKSAIGIFDSGIGGISVFKQFVKVLPNERYIYLGDTARVPYGNKSKETVREYARECTEFLKSKNVKLIAVACNTVSSVALDEVISVAGDIPVIGMISPAAYAAVQSSLSGRIGIIGTRATINSNAYKEAINSIDSHLKYDLISSACPLFVPIVEEGLNMHSASKLIAEEYLSEMLKHNIDTLVLGCTHYPFLTGLIKEILPNVNLIDTGEQAAIKALRLLAEAHKLSEDTPQSVGLPQIEFYVTDLPDMFFEVAKKYLGFELNQPQLVKIN